MVRLDEGVYRAGDAVTVTLEDADQQETRRANRRQGELLDSYALKKWGAISNEGVHSVLTRLD